MSIYAYVGMPGSGKSYDVVASQVLPALENDRTVVTNIPLNRDAVREITRNGEIINFPIDVVAQDPHKIDEYARAGCVLILDEIWRLWPAGQKANQVPEPFKSLLAEHRHRVDKQDRAMQIVLVTQDLAQIGAFARQLVEQTYNHTKLNEVGMSSSYRIDIYQGAVTGQFPSQGRKINTVFGKYKPKIFKLYQSATMSSGKSGAGDERTLDGRGNVWRRWQVWAGALFVVVASTWGMSTLADLVSVAEPADVSVANATGSANAPPASVNGSSSPQAFKSDAPGGTALMPTGHAERRKTGPSYRIAGFIRVSEDDSLSVALITDGRRNHPIPWSQCRDMTDGDVECEFNGRKVGLFGDRE